MDRVTALLDQIDEVTAGCRGCPGDVPAGGPSDVFCSEACQERALASMGDPLPPDSSLAAGLHSVFVLGFDGASDRLNAAVSAQRQQLQLLAIVGLRDFEASRAHLGRHEGLEATLIEAITEHGWPAVRDMCNPDDCRCAEEVLPIVGNGDRDFIDVPQSGRAGTTLREVIDRSSRRNRIASLRNLRWRDVADEVSSWNGYDRHDPVAETQAGEAVVVSGEVTVGRTVYVRLDRPDGTVRFEPRLPHE